MKFGKLRYTMIFLYCLQAGITLSESRGLKTSGAENITPWEGLWVGESHWCKSQSLKAWKPGDLMSKGGGGEQEELEELKKNNQLFLCLFFFYLCSQGIGWLIPTHIS